MGKFPSRNDSCLTWENRGQFGKVIYLTDTTQWPTDMRLDLLQVPPESEYLRKKRSVILVAGEKEFFAL